MSAQSPRYPAPAPDSLTGGRHRRPESLADVEPTDGARTAVTTLAGTPRHRDSASRRDSTSRRDPASRRDSTSRRDPGSLRDPAARPGTRSARHQRPAGGGRHAAARVPAQRTAGTRPPITGTHRAPGTLPIESWLLMGKTRQQALLASLVAVGILLLAMPAEQRREGVDAVNAAAQAVAGVQTGARPAEPAEPRTEKPRTSPTRKQEPAGSKETKQPEAAPAPTTPAAVPTSAAPQATAPSRAPRDQSVTGPGPGDSLRTTGSRAVALTFDDGPDPVHTPQILALLDKYDVEAVFCLVGEQVTKHPGIVRQIVEAGHTLCNHSWNHSFTLGKDEPEQIRADLARTNAAIRAAAPGTDVPFFRAPGGNFTDRLVTVAGEDGMTSLYWQVDPRDWDHTADKTPEAHVERIIEDVRRNVRPGSIVLSHDFGQPGTVTAYEKLLPWLTENFTLGLPAPKPSAPAASSAPADR